MSYNGSGTFVINSTGQPVVTGTVISSTAFNALTADLATGLSTAITKDGQTTTTARVPFAQGISSTLVTDATSTTTGSIISAGGISCQKALFVGTTSNFAGTLTGAAANFGVLTASAASGNATLGIKNTSLSGKDWYFLTTTSSGESDLGLYYAGGGAGTKVTITNGGLVGIGMTPSNVLDITQTQNALSIACLKNASAGTSARMAYQLDNATSATYLVHNGPSFTTSGVDRQDGTKLTCGGAGGLTLATGVAQPIYFAINNAEKARIGTDGSFLIGGTTNIGGGLYVAAQCLVGTTSGNSCVMSVGRVGGDVAYFKMTGSSGANATIYCDVDNTANRLIDFRYNGSDISYWTTNGSTSTFNNPSDIRFKTVAEKQFDYSGPIKAMQMVDFNWTETGASDFGGLAQQAYEAFADTPIRDVLVSKPKNPEDKWYMAPDYYGRIALWGVKDLYKIIDDLTTRLAALENK
jgi:hypothetical protein